MNGRLHSVVIDQGTLFRWCYLCPGRCDDDKCAAHVAGASSHDRNCPSREPLVMQPTIHGPKMQFSQSAGLLGR